MNPVERGFTLIELMIVVAIMAVLMSIAVPAFSELVRANRITTQANDFVAAIHTARSEAIRRGAPVCLKRLGDTEKDWSNGWEIFVDGEVSRTFTDDSKRCSTKAKLPPDDKVDYILQTHDALMGDNTIKSSGNNYKTAIRFNFMGVPVDNNDNGIADTFVLCRSDNPDGKSKLIGLTSTGVVGVIAHTCS